jgi:hypothetical protein
MLKNTFQRSFLLITFLILGGCATPYPFAKDEKTASVKLMHMGDAKFCKAGNFYSMQPVEGTNAALVPAGERIDIGTYMSFHGYNVTHSCYPILSFSPIAGKSYVLHSYIRDTKCFAELVREDGASVTGISLEPSVGPRGCYKK